MIMNGIGVAGRLLPALLSDRFLGPFNTYIPTVFFGGVMLFAWIAVNTYDQMIAFAVIYGFWAHAVQTMFPATLSTLTTDLTKMGVRVGMNFTIMSISCLTGPPIAGALISASNGSFLWAQVFGGTSMILGTVCLVGSRVVLLRGGGKWRA